MRINPANFLSAFAISALIAFGLWSLDGDLKIYVAIGSFVYLFGTLGPAIGIDYELARNSTNLRVICIVFFFAGLSINLGVAFFGGSKALYILTNAISFIVYIILANFIYNAKQ